MKIRNKHLVVFLLVVLSLTLIGCGVPQKDYDALQAHLDQVQKDYVTVGSQLNSLQKDFDAAKAQLSSTQQDYDTAKSQLDSAQSEIKKLQSTVAGQSDTLKQTQEEVSQLESHLNAILDAELTQYYQVTYPPYHYAWDLPVSLRSYFSYKEKSRPSELGAMVTGDDATIDTLVRVINDSALNNNLKKSDVVNLIARFTQSLPHTNQDVKTPYDEYPRYPLETLVEQGGDSEDTSILAATILSMLDFEVVFLSYGPQKHVAIGVYMPGTGGYNWEYQGKRYYSLETTGEYWQLGECPPQYVGLTPTVYPIGG
jgi:outer membrane murein-binding lipoprotein Lpp